MNCDRNHPDLNMENFMKTIASMGVAAVIALSHVVGAGAVEVFNDDAIDHELVLQDESGEFTMVIGGGEDLKNICNSCTIRLNDGEPVKALGDELILIEGGRLFPGG